MVNHPNRSVRKLQPGVHDLGKGWRVEYHEAQPSGAPEAMEFYHVDADQRRLILGPDSIAKLRAIMAYI